MWLHHFSLGRQKATLESFKGDGSGKFGLEFAGVLPFRNHALHSSFRTKGQTSTELLSKPVACPAEGPLLVVASFFFRALESNVREF